MTPMMLAGITRGTKNVEIKQSVHMKNGQIIGKYRILGVLGRGGGGTVYLAQDVVLEKIWAIKAVKKDRERILRESLLMKNLDHPGLPRITGQMEDEENFYLVMDYIEGENLYERCKKSPATAEEALDWGIQICDILDYLHRQKPPVLYRDLKPGNLILTPDGRIKLVDFGIARQQDGSECADAYGTKGFAAPEQYEGKAMVQTDLYSLGACLCWCLRGQKIPGLAFVLWKCMKKDPKKRYPNSRKLKEKLQKYQEKRRKRRKERKILLVCLAAVFLLGIGEILREGISHYRNVVFIRITGQEDITVHEVWLNGEKISFRTGEEGIYIPCDCLTDGKNQLFVKIRDGSGNTCIRCDLDF